MEDLEAIIAQKKFLHSEEQKRKVEEEQSILAGIAKKTQQKLDAIKAKKQHLAEQGSTFLIGLESDVHGSEWAQ